MLTTLTISWCKSSLRDKFPQPNRYMLTTTYGGHPWPRWTRVQPVMPSNVFQFIYIWTSVDIVRSIGLAHRKLSSDGANYLIYKTLLKPICDQVWRFEKTILYGKNVLRNKNSALNSTTTQCGRVWTTSPLPERFSRLRRRLCRGETISTDKESTTERVRFFTLYSCFVGKKLSSFHVHTRVLGDKKWVLSPVITHVFPLVRPLRTDHFVRTPFGPGHSVHGHF